MIYFNFKEMVSNYNNWKDREFDKGIFIQIMI